MCQATTFFSEAKSLLDSAGWRAGSDGIRRKGNERLTLTLKTYVSESARLNENVAKALVPMMKEIGVELKVEVVGYREFMASWENQGLRKHGDFDMKLSPPKQVTFWIAVIVALVGVVVGIVSIPGVSPFALWIVVLGFVILALGNLLEGL